MTKLRAPLSIEQALARIAGQLPDGYDSMSAITQRSASLVRKWGDPDRGEEIPLKDAIALDIAYQAQGGEGHPLYDSFGAQIELAETCFFSDRFALLARTHDVSKECGEAIAAMIRACSPSASPRERDEAARELAEAFEAIKPALAMLTSPDAAAASGVSSSHEHGARAPP